MNSTLTNAIAASIVVAAAGSAGATIHQWDWQVGDPGSYSTNNNGGTFESISTTFNTSTNALTWGVTFSDQITEGFTLAINNGPNPKGHAGELALLYVDLTNLPAPRMLAYAYNGQNSNNSYFDGVGNVAGNQTPDDIVDVEDRGGSGWIDHLTVEDTMDGKRHVSFAIDATVINTNTPLYPGATPWTGAAFDENFGLWFHQYKNLSTSYDAATGLLTGWSGNSGYFDGSGFVTTEVPAPGPVALIAGAGVLAGTRRRRG
jgi:hypothetical protein